VVPVTTFSQAEEIIAALNSAGIENLSVRMTGWANGGVSQEVLTKVRVPRSLGGEKGMKALIAAAEKAGVELYFDGVSCFAYNSGLMEGFVPFRDAARFTTREQVVIYPYSVITYQPEEWRDPYYLVQPHYAHRMAENLLSALSGQGAAGVAFRDIGSLLSGDYNPKNTTTREQVRAMNIETLEKAEAAGLNVMVKEGFDFVLPYADLITDMDLKGTEYSIIDEKVPFYQMAVHGAVSYTGAPVNLASDWKAEILRCAEYGAGLNFTFMQEEGTILQNTFHSGYYGAEFASWAEKIEEIAGMYQKDMAGLNQIRMTGHEILADGITATVYENGTTVYVNYTDKDYEAGGVIVPARSYHAEGGDGQ